MESKTLSVGGRLALLKSVLGATPLFTMSIFKAPKGVLHEMESIRSNFFNGVDPSKRKITWVAWDKVLAVTPPDGAWTEHVAIYGSSLESHSVNFPSTWCSILREVQVLSSIGFDFVSHCKKRVGDGQNTRFWLDTWILDVPFSVRFPRIYALERDNLAFVAAKWGASSFDASFRRQVRDGAECQQWSDMLSLLGTVTLSSSIDRWVCDLNGEGVFRVKEIRSILDDIFFPSAVEATRWVKFIPIKINVFAWRARFDRLPTRCNLFNRGVIMDSSLCPMCGLVPEDSHHVFFRCNLAKIIFRRICRWWDLHWVDVSTFADWNAWFATIRLYSKLKLMLEGVFYVAWWHIWAFRNHSIFDEVNNLQWTLASVPCIKALQLAFSFFFWYSCFYFQTCSLWMSFGVYVTGLLFETASIVSFLLIAHGYCITSERLSVPERRTMAVIGCVFYLILVGHRASIPYFSILLVLDYLLIFFVIFNHITQNLSLLSEQLNFIEDEDVQEMRDAVYTKYLMFKKFKGAMHIVAIAETAIFINMDSSMESYWMKLLVREWAHFCIFLYIGWIFRSQDLAPRFSVMPTHKSKKDRIVPPIYSIELDAASFKDFSSREWQIGVHNIKFLHCLQPEWRRFSTSIRQNKDPNKIGINYVFDLLKHNQEEANYETSGLPAAEGNRDVPEGRRSELNWCHPSKGKTRERILGREADERLKKPYKESVEIRPFTSESMSSQPRAIECPMNLSNIKGSTDPDDYIPRFVGAANQGEWEMSVCWTDLREKFVERFALRRRCIKDPTEVLKIIRRDNETFPNFKERWNEEMGYIQGVLEVMQISAFMSNSKCPELARRFADQVPQTVTEMMKRVNDFRKSEKLGRGEHPLEGQGMP
ncbi:RNA-directed DNA polymerase, eukaryota [Tanacetum coccineum]